MQPRDIHTHRPTVKAIDVPAGKAMAAAAGTADPRAPSRSPVFCSWQVETRVNEVVIVVVVLVVMIVAELQIVAVVVVREIAIIVGSNGGSGLRAIYSTADRSYLVDAFGEEGEDRRARCEACFDGQIELGLPVTTSTITTTTVSTNATATARGSGAGGSRQQVRGASPCHFADEPPALRLEATTQVSKQVSKKVGRQVSPRVLTGRGGGDEQC